MHPRSSCASVARSLRRVTLLRESNPRSSDPRAICSLTACPRGRLTVPLLPRQCQPRQACASQHNTQRARLPSSSRLPPRSSTADRTRALTSLVCSLADGSTLLPQSFLERGADLAFLSAFPGEDEFLLPPLTCLRPTGNAQTITFRSETGQDSKYTVVEVEPLQ